MNTNDQLGKALKELKRDIEFAYVGQDNAEVAGNNSGPVAREMDSASQLIHSGNTIDAGSGSTDPLTESKLLDAHEAAYTAGGDPTLFMIKPSDSEIVAGFTQHRVAIGHLTMNQTLTNAVNMMVNPYGTLQVVLNRIQMSTHMRFCSIPRCGVQQSLRPTNTHIACKDRR